MASITDVRRGAKSDADRKITLTAARAVWAARGGDYKS
jgi:hypothetical protein